MTKVHILNRLDRLPFAGLDSDGVPVFRAQVRPILNSSDLEQLREAAPSPRSAATGKKPVILGGSSRERPAVRKAAGRR